MSPNENKFLGFPSPPTTLNALLWIRSIALIVLDSESAMYKVSFKMQSPEGYAQVHSLGLSELLFPSIPDPL